MIQAGSYRARAVDYQFGFAETGTEQVAVTFEIVEEGEYQGSTITWFGFFTDATAERTIEALRTCGWQGDNLGDLTGIDRNEVSLVIVHEPYNGKQIARVKWVNRPGTGRVELKRKMDAVQKAALARRLRALVVASKERAPRDAKPQAPRTGGGAGYPGDWDAGGL